MQPSLLFSISLLSTCACRFEVTVYGLSRSLWFHSPRVCRIAVFSNKPSSHIPCHHQCSNRRKLHLHLRSKFSRERPVMPRPDGSTPMSRNSCSDESKSLNQLGLGLSPCELNHACTTTTRRAQQIRWRHTCPALLPRALAPLSRACAADPLIRSARMHNVLHIQQDRVEKGSRLSLSGTCRHTMLPHRDHAVGDRAEQRRTESAGADKQDEESEMRGKANRHP